MRQFITAFVAATLIWIASASAQIVQFSGAATSTPSAQYLVQQYGTPGLLLSVTKENSAYGGNCMTVRRASGGTQVLGWINTKQCDTTTFDSFCAATTCFLDTWNDQSGNGLDCVQATTTRQPQVLKKADGVLTIKSNDSTDGCEVADNAAIRFAAPQLFTARLHPFLDIGNESTSFHYGPTGSSTSARWGLVWSYVDAGMFAPVNASSNFLGYGQGTWAGDGTNFFVNDYKPGTLDLRGSGGFQIIPASSSTTVTYSGTIKFVVGNNLSYNNGFAGEEFRMVVLYNSTVSNANRDAIVSYIESANSLNITPLPWIFTAGNGFTFSTFTPIGYNGDNFTDAFGNVWTPEDGGYLYSNRTATNLSSPSTTTLYRVEVRPGDLDVVVNAEERSERNLLSNNNATWQRGGSLSEFFQIYFEPGSCVDVGTGWNFNSQHHTGGGGEPDNLTFTAAKSSGFPSIGCDQLQWITQDGSSTNLRGSAFSYSRGTWYAVVIHAFWSATGTGDTLEIWMGPNGGTLTKIVNLSTPQHLFWGSPATDANVKTGAYSHNLNTNFAYQIGNWQYDTVTPNAYTSYITTQPALPAHP